MTLRCRPGDLAIVTMNFAGPQFNWMIGRVVRVVRIDPDSHAGVPRWEIEQAINLPYGVGEVLAISDRCLRPIRPDTEPVDVPAEEGVTC